MRKQERKRKKTEKNKVKDIYASWIWYSLGLRSHSTAGPALTKSPQSFCLLLRASKSCH